MNTGYNVQMPVYSPEEVIHMIETVSADPKVKDELTAIIRRSAKLSEQRAALSLSITNICGYAGDASLSVLGDESGYVVPEGISYDKSQNRYRTSYKEGKRLVQKVFSIRAHGEKKALSMAVEQRKQWIQEGKVPVKGVRKENMKSYYSARAHSMSNGTAINMSAIPPALTNNNGVRLSGGAPNEHRQVPGSDGSHETTGELPNGILPLGTLHQGQYKNEPVRAVMMDASNGQLDVHKQPAYGAAEHLYGPAMDGHALVPPTNVSNAEMQFILNTFGFLGEHADVHDPNQNTYGGSSDREGHLVNMTNQTENRIGVDGSQVSSPAHNAEHSPLHQSDAPTMQYLSSISMGVSTSNYNQY